MVSFCMLKRALYGLLVSLLAWACSKEKKAVDLIVHHATIYSVDSAFAVYEAMSIRDGKVVEIGSNEAILGRYEASQEIDAKGRFIYPGFIDAHCHFTGYGLGLRQVDLTGTKSFDEVLHRTQDFAHREQILPDGVERKLDGTSEMSWLVGRGWDQNDWSNPVFPERFRLDSLFPDRPVLLIRIDGHAALANAKALELAGITAKTSVTGGEIPLVQHAKKGLQPSGMLIDNAVDLVKAAIPPTEKKDLYAALLNAQQNCFAAGLTTVDDAGVMYDEVEAMDELQKAGKLKMRIYAMLSDSAPNYKRYLSRGPYKTDRLNVRSFKFYADGALGSRGACLFRDYNDKAHWRGFLLSNMEHFRKYADMVDRGGFQMNTHCIGDSALNMVMDIYIRHCNKKKDRRWRIEHAQVVAPDDVKSFSKDIIPSVQPTHATSDMYWVEQRLGPDRLKYAYAYKELLNAAGTIALGTDFPVEDISAIKTFYAAVTRQDAKGYPPGGFQMENALDRKQALRGMTVWAAYANFEEKEKGSLEAGKFADFVILDTDLMNCKEHLILKTKILQTYINGEQVFSSN